MRRTITSLILASTIALAGCDRYSTAAPGQESAALPARETKTSESPEERKLDELVRELSKYEIVHFGEYHAVEKVPGVDTTAEDFANHFVRRFRDEKIVGANKFTRIRMEAIPCEFDETGRVTVHPIEFTSIEANGIADMTRSPEIKQMLDGTYDSEGQQKIIKESSKNGYSIRGHFPPVQVLEIFSTILTAQGKEEAILIFGSLQVSAYCEEAVKKDMTAGERVLIYGGEVHNNSPSISNDRLETQLNKAGLSDILDNRYPEKYIAVDLIKLPYVRGPEEISRFSKLLANKVPNEIVILRGDEIPRDLSHRADYLVFLPDKISTN